jgi:excisionase family DNA binding protein
MSENWMTVEQAAVTLGLSVRTVTRHINAGKLQSRLTDGRREVQIDSVQIPGAVGASGAIANTETFTDPDNAIDCETVLALADNAADKAELAVSAYQTLARSADERIHSTRRMSYAAWSIVAVMTVCTIVCVGWASHKMTRDGAGRQRRRRVRRPPPHARRRAGRRGPRRGQARGIQRAARSRAVDASVTVGQAGVVVRMSVIEVTSERHHAYAPIAGSPGACGFVVRSATERSDSTTASDVHLPPGTSIARAPRACPPIQNSPPV